MADIPLAQDDPPHGWPPRGWRRFVYSTNHRDIGTMYFVFALIAALVGLYLATAIRAETMAPGLQDFKDTHAFDVFATTHGIVMMFFVALPATIGGFGNWLVPLTIGAPGTAFPRMNNLSFWLMPFSFVLLILSLFVGGEPGGLGTGADWTLAPPLSSQGSPGPAVDFALFALVGAIVSLLLGAINLIATILNMRAPGMTLQKLPLFAWSILVSAFLLLLTLPVLAGAFAMLMADRHFATTFFNASGGGDPVLYRHLFWFFGHAAGWVVVLPGAGMIAHVIPAFSGRAVFGRGGFICAMAAAGILAIAGWAQHMPTSGLSTGTEAYFVLAGLAGAVPVSVMVFSLIATLWGGSISFRAPMLWAFGFLPIFALGGLTGLALANPGTGTLLHDSAFDAAQFHTMIGASGMFSFFAGWYFWFPKITGYLYDEALAQVHFWLALGGVVLSFGPMFFLGLAGMPAQVADYPEMYRDWNYVSSIGAFAMGAGLLAFLGTMVEALVKKRRAADNPWGDYAKGLEWTLSSPPPFYTFDELPRIRR